MAPCAGASAAKSPRCPAEVTAWRPVAAVRRRRSALRPMYRMLQPLVRASQRMKLRQMVYQMRRESSVTYMKNGGNDHRDHCHQGPAYQSYAPYADAATAALLRWFGGRLRR